MATEAGWEVMVAARVREMYDRQAADRMKVGKKNPMEKIPQGQEGTARDAAGKAVGVNGKYVDHATKVLTKAIPEAREVTGPRIDQT